MNKNQIAREKSIKERKTLKFRESGDKFEIQNRFGDRKCRDVR